ncbi:hypothetical protein ABMA28_008076 [Loxostege sticticalis]|uniref:Reverse transcriptase domain-containing protein n=1 Tax=Loxostege sticticalis TaxID=481309 RepID=A0ABD0SFX8_LOXSC
MQPPDETCPVQDNPSAQSRGCSPILGPRPASPSATQGSDAPGSSSTGQHTRTGFVPITFMQTMMQEMMSKLIETTASAFHTNIPKPVPRVRSLEHIYVPPFDPDDRTDTIQVWCKNLDDLKTEYELTDREILNLSRKNLRGRAAEYSRRNYTTLTSWTELKTRLVETFADEARYYDDLILFMEYNSEQASSITEYATRKWELARKAIGVELTEQRLVEAVISDDTLISRDSYNINLVQKFDANTLNVNTEIDSKYKNQLHDILDSCSEMFTIGNKVSQITTGELNIRLKNPDKIVQRRPYRLAPGEREHVKAIIKDLKDNNIIRDSNSPFASPILLVRKKDGSDRLCVDYRELNRNTVRDHFPLPLIDDHISKLSKARYFTVLDMTAGFHQIPVAPDSIEKTAFVTPDGQFEFLRMPFGLCNAPPVFQRAISTALKPFVDEFVLIYIDDVVIYSETPEQENTSRRSWKDSVGEVQLAINSTFNKSTGHTPFQLLMGCNQSPPAISTLLENVERLDLETCRSEAKCRMDEQGQTHKEQFDKTKAKLVPFKIGDIVLVKQNPRSINKLDSKFRNELYVSHDNLRLMSPEVGYELIDTLNDNEDNEKQFYHVIWRLGSCDLTII